MNIMYVQAETLQGTLNDLLQKHIAIANDESQPDITRYYSSVYIHAIAEVTQILKASAVSKEDIEQLQLSNFAIGSVKH